MRRAADSSAAPGAPGRLLPARLAALAAVLLAAIVTAVATAGPAAAQFRVRDDWHHVDAVVAALRHDPPLAPVVLLLGGSSARESITTERDWRRQIAALGGGRVRRLRPRRVQSGLQDDSRSCAHSRPSRRSSSSGSISAGTPRSIPHQRDRPSGPWGPSTTRTGSMTASSLRTRPSGCWSLVGCTRSTPSSRTGTRGNARLLRTLIALCRSGGSLRCWSAPDRPARRPPLARCAPRPVPRRMSSGGPGGRHPLRGFRRSHRARESRFRRLLPPRRAGARQYQRRPARSSSPSSSSTASGRESAPRRCPAAR